MPERSTLGFQRCVESINPHWASVVDYCFNRFSLWDQCCVPNTQHRSPPLRIWTVSCGDSRSENNCHQKSREELRGASQKFYKAWNFEILTKDLPSGVHMQRVCTGQQTKITDALAYTLKAKWKWAGHVARLTDNPWTLRLTKWPGPTGNLARGRPQYRWDDDIKNVAGPNWMLKAKNRQRSLSLEEVWTLKKGSS
ncbi:jg12879 [Pararge aegeria aegeria]|uniref:Jg12879 protein n=1 Tax=Pararge aegeria aegeria TaxID=348720 RepID=A0A8S4RZV6_9NEOP|nr:jg12879 [Pararge aegeria aegeria]